ncbi:hypothetical protein QBE52_00530 [Clostridiaceae bacterium 35-E11]
MGRRRVGTLSMAVLLIASGGIMMLAQMSRQPILEVAIKGWPLILFLLGGEILWYSYKSKDENIKIKYDLFSIFIICIVVVFHLTIYGMLQLDMVSKLDVMISSQHYSLKTPVEEFVLDSNIKKIIIDAPSLSKLTVRSNKGNKITALGTARVTANTKEKAQELLNTKNIVIHKTEDTLYLSFNIIDSGNAAIDHARITAYTLTIPNNRKVEINNGERIELLVDNLNNDWIVDDCYQTDIRIGETANIKINAFVDEREALKGNTEWMIEEKNSSNEDAEMETNALEDRIKGGVIQGEGTHKINVLNSRQVIVNQLM